MNVYEWTVQRYLDCRGMRFARVHDLQRVRANGGRRKNFDFLVDADEWPDRGGLLLEVKGRQFPTSGGAVWENWVTGDDLDCLTQWAQHFGESYRPILVFVYRHVDPNVRPGRPWTPMRVDHEQFGLVGVPLAAYRECCRLRSRRWQTYHVPRAAFAKLARPLVQLLPASDGSGDSTTTRIANALERDAWASECAPGPNQAAQPLRPMRSRNTPGDAA